MYFRFWPVSYVGPLNFSNWRKQCAESTIVSLNGRYSTPKTSLEDALSTLKLSELRVKFPGVPSGIWLSRSGKLSLRMSHIS